MKNELGVNDGRLIAGSIWQYPKEVGGNDRNFRVEEPGSEATYATLSMQDGERWQVGHGWNASRIAKEWRLVSVPAEGEVYWKPINREMPKVEERARTAEKLNNLADAKKYRVQAAALVETDARIVAEESALKEKRYIAKTQLKRLAPGDRACYTIKGLKEFAAHAEAKEYLYWD